MPDGELPTDLSQVVVMDRTVFQRLQNRIPELKSEVCEQKQLFKEARQKHARLKRKNAEMGKRVKAGVEPGSFVPRATDKHVELKGTLPLAQFAGPAFIPEGVSLSHTTTHFTDLVPRVGLHRPADALRNRVLEELKQEQSLREVRYAKEIRQWDRKVDEARDELNQAIRGNSERMARLNQLQESREPDRKLNTQQQSVVFAVAHQPKCTITEFMLRRRSCALTVAVVRTSRGEERDRKRVQPCKEQQFERRDYQR
ncbi:hypothetical protein WMY93_020587 [Mugilogobius chulae]|uniref:Uncharacterized protein n=1 Tax=Mugilogobius chulae TaxID=88201 RepID=A0AAW0NIW3_9GOBI